MSAIMTVSACMPMNSISAMAADKAGAGATEVAAEATAAQESAAAVQEAEAEPAVEPTVEPTQEPAAEPAVEPQQPETTETGDTGTGSASTSEAGSGNGGATDDDKDGNGSASTGDTTGAATGDTTGAASDGTTAGEAEVADEADTAATTEDVEDAGKDTTDDADAAATDAATASTTELEAEEDATVKKEAKSISDEDFATADNIAYGDTVTGTCNEEDPYAVYRFTPSKTAYYTFEVRMTDNGETLWGDVYDSDYERMYVGDITYLTPGSFDLRALLYEGSTYYFVAQMVEEWDTGSFDITVSSSLQVNDASDNTINVVPGGEVALIAEAYSLNDISYEWTYTAYNDGQTKATGNGESFTFTAISSGSAYLQALTGYP